MLVHQIVKKNNKLKSHCWTAKAIGNAMLIRTNGCQSQCVRAASMVCSSVQTDKAQEHHSFPKRDCGSISSEKACLWDINYWEKCVLLHSKQDSYWHFFCFGLGKSMTAHLHLFPVISYAIIVHKEKRMRTGIDSNSDSFMQAPHRVLLQHLSPTEQTSLFLESWELLLSQTDAANH